MFFKRILFLLLLCLISCKSQTNINGFTRIEEKFQDRNTLIESIKPDKEYLYWEYVYFTGLDKRSVVLKSHGDISLKDNYQVVFPQTGFFRECLPTYCYSYIMYFENNSFHYITEKTELQKFIGKIDNFGEAILVAKINNLWFDLKQMELGSYIKTKKGYELFMMKAYDCPLIIESIKVKIDFNGKFSAKNNGIYQISEDCDMS